MGKTERQSNIEALRIISMILVMIVHASFKSLSMPTLSEIEDLPVSSFFRFFSESLSIVCVNSFILISGWFSIKVNILRFIEFLFQVVFISTLFYLILICLDFVNTGSFEEWFSYFFHNNYWFITSYIILYCFSPILNTFTNNTEKKDFRSFLFVFFIIQTIFGFIFPTPFFSNGYSPLSFMGLYLLARYIKLYAPRLSKLAPIKDFTIFLGLALINSSFAILLLTWGHGNPWKLYSYSAPLVVTESLYLLLYFTKLSFKSKIINWIASSCFAAYLIHCHPAFFDTIYIKHITISYISHNTLYFFIDTSIWIILIFLFSIVFDKIRLLIWKCLIRDVNNRTT